ncbi:hypothetical protein [Kitasatospora sp. McL0602]|uniref:hypothetical protein n=1 Tax=Kitasatospora sp. McL0602 TaxID=3439530 RepID=UPI003F8C54FA
MPISKRPPTVLPIVLLVISAALVTGCSSPSVRGELRFEDLGPTAPAVGSPSPSANSPSPSVSASPGPAGPSPYVEPGVVDGAPHNGDNNAYRRPAGMSADGEASATAEAGRIKPLLEQLHAAGKFDPESVGRALEPLGYPAAELTVRGMYARYEDSGYVTPPGTMIGLRVAKDACVTAFVQPSNVGVSVNGPYSETGCLPPPLGH